jgi:hypothetical protein
VGRGHSPREDRAVPDNASDRPEIGWPDWSGETVAIIASGPSAKKAKLELLRGRAKVIAIKQNIDLCPWADAVYGCDAAWWRFRRGLPEFNGLKITWAGNGLEYPDVRKITIAKIKRGADVYSDQFQVNGDSIGGGGNSGFQALNLATVQFKARRIVLIGFDMHDRGGKHWYGRNHWPMANNPAESNFKRWIAAFNQAAPILAGLGIQVMNATPNSALRCFPFVDLEQIFGSADIGLAGLRSA